MSDTGKIFPVPPFTISNFGLVYDSTGSCVLACDRNEPCKALYREQFIDENPHFMCPNCGRIGIRMEEATPKQCGF